MEITGNVERIEFDGNQYTFYISRNQVVYASKNLFNWFHPVPKVGDFVIFEVDSYTMHAFSCK